MQYTPRLLEQRIEEALSIHPVVILTGPRQVGKSTLLKYAHFLKNWKYITLDDPDALLQAKEDPKGLLLENVPTIVDEVQRHPSLFLTIKYFVDQSQRKRKFILSGSGNISLRQYPRESLAGRAKYLSLTPFSLSEIFEDSRESFLRKVITGEKIPSFELKKLPEYCAYVWKGGLPGVQTILSEKKIFEVLASYVDTYLERDIQDLVNVRHPEHFRLLMSSLAKAAGWEALQEQLAQICAETRSNISRYMSILKETSLLYEVKGYVSKNEKAYRQAKYYWFDSAVACFLAGIFSSKELQKPTLKGRYFENFIFQQIIAFSQLQTIPLEIYYWKHKRREGEIDFIVKQLDTIIPVEVKSSNTLTFRDTQSIRYFFQNHPESQRGLIVYTGTKVYPIASNIYAVPWSLL